jgi:hypothetical protein
VCEILIEKLAHMGRPVSAEHVLLAAAKKLSRSRVRKTVQRVTNAVGFLRKTHGGIKLATAALAAGKSKGASTDKPRAGAAVAALAARAAGNAGGGGDAGAGSAAGAGAAAGGAGGGGARGPSWLKRVREAQAKGDAAAAAAGGGGHVGNGVIGSADGANAPTVGVDEVTPFSSEAPARDVPLVVDVDVDAEQPTKIESTPVVRIERMDDEVLTPPQQPPAHVSKLSVRFSSVDLTEVLANSAKSPAASGKKVRNLFSGAGVACYICVGRAPRVPSRSVASSRSQSLTLTPPCVSSVCRRSQRRRSVRRRCACLPCTVTVR